MARALALIVAGGLVIAGRESIPALLILLGGIGLVYLGVAEVMRMLAPPAPEVAAEPSPAPLPHTRRAVAAGLVLVAVVAAIFTGRALQSEEQATVSACNGHRELCNGRVDDVELRLLAQLDVGGHRAGLAVRHPRAGESAASSTTACAGC